ncbi:MAG: ATP-grasp domain-containing protein [Clostridia bacterium]|nr:ATP-grasp domain-containing protein [Clostridia bacterium]
MKKLMILGAGIYQVPLIKKAKELGLYTIAVSIKGNYPGFAFADEVCYVDTTDIDAVLALAKEKQIDGICTSGTDVAIPAIGKVCDEMGLPGISYQAALMASNKSDMKRCFMEHGVSTAKYFIAHSENEAMDFMDQLEFPVIFKAVDTSGSRGIMRVNEKDVDQVRKAIENIKSVTKKDFFIIEEFIEGVEFGAQALIAKGELKFVMPHGDYVFVGDTGVPVGHYVPYDLPEDVFKESIRQVKLSAQAMQLDNCAMNVDFILKEDQVYMLEVGARAGATCLCEMVEIYYQTDFYKMIIQTALGEELSSINFDHCVPNVCKLFLAEKTGIIEQIEIPKIEDDRIFDLSFDYQPGDHVKKFRIGPDRIGQIIVKGKTLEEAVELMEAVMKDVKVTIREQGEH